MKKILLLGIFILFLVACNSSINEEQEIRTEILYAHTWQMIQLSSQETLDEIGLNITFLDNRPGITHDEMLSQLEQSYNVTNTGSYEKRISRLEKRMEEMMIEWDRLENRE